MYANNDNKGAFQSTQGHHTQQQYIKNQEILWNDEKINKHIVWNK